MRKIFCSIIVATALISGIAGCQKKPDPTGLIQRPIRNERDKLSAEHCRGINNFCDCASKIEKIRITEFPNVTRSGSTLRIKLETGRFAELADIEQTIRVMPKKYRFQDRVNGYYVFQVCCWEWSEVLVMNPVSGGQATSINEPIFSPDGKYFASFQNCPFCKTGVEIFDVTGLVPKKVFEALPREWKPTGMAWLANDTVSISSESENAHGKKLNEEPRKLQLANGTWMFHKN